jgi:hypothetical protein
MPRLGLLDRRGCLSSKVSNERDGWSNWGGGGGGGGGGVGVLEDGFFDGDEAPSTSRLASSMPFRQCGQVLCSFSHALMHCVWNQWLQ